MIRRLLIANRGEIALRIIRGARELGIETVAVYSDADAEAPHVWAADQAVRLGPAPARDSYLQIEALLAAAHATQADAIHPGYGFLSERQAFAAACEAAGLTFVGPTSQAIAAMGSKVGARQLMQAAGVPVVPGDTPASQTLEGVTEAARRVGFPLLIKPSAGGGGIGMQAVHHPGDLEAAVLQAQREAERAFGDPTLYVERLVERPRHVEVQVFGDRHGGLVHLFERECSVQRRHQKVIEESPSPALTPALRARMGEAAVAAARAVQYQNAGTIEFLLEGTGDEAQFYFLEMNTRLQVEHPVTECVTGVDLVHAQLRVASGEPLPWSQQSLSQRGHAIECRIYAEEPAAGFLPQAGRVVMYREPQGPGIRVDSGIREGSEISVFYDPMLAKLIVQGATRAETIRRTERALRDFIVLGVGTNVSLLLALVRHPAFAEGAVDIAFLDRELEALVRSLPVATEPSLFAAAALVASQPDIDRTTSGISRIVADPFDSLPGWLA